MVSRQTPWNESSLPCLHLSVSGSVSLSDTYCESVSVAVFSLSPSLCLCLYLCLCESVSVAVFSLSPSLCLCICLCLSDTHCESVSVASSLSLCVSVSHFLTLYHSGCLTQFLSHSPIDFLALSVCLSVCLPVCLFFCVSVCFFLCIYLLPYFHFLSSLCLCLSLVAFFVSVLRYSLFLPGSIPPL